MTTTTASTDIKKWLAATTVSEEEKQRFIAHYEEVGHFTPRLAEEFAQILAHSMDTYNDEVETYTQMMADRAQEVEAISEELDSKYESLIGDLSGKIAANNERGRQEVEQLDTFYQEVVLGTDTENVSSILGNA